MNDTLIGHFAHKVQIHEYSKYDLTNDTLSGCVFIMGPDGVIFTFTTGYGRDVCFTIDENGKPRNKSILQPLRGDTMTFKIYLERPPAGIAPTTNHSRASANA